MRILRPMLVISSAALLGCGQKGPLVLPDAQRPHKQISIPRPTATPAQAPAAAAPSTPAAPAGPGPTTAPTAPTDSDSSQAAPDASPHL